MTSLRALVIRNLTIQTVSEIVGLACGLASSMLLSRYLDVAGFGAFNYTFAFMYFFLSVNDFGLSTVAVREISREPASAASIIGALLSLRLYIAFAVLLLAWAVIWLWPMDPALRPPLSLFALILPLNALNVPSLIFQTAMRFELGAVANIVLRVAGLVMIALALLNGAGVTVVLGLLLVAEAIGVAVAWLLARRLVTIRFRKDPALWRMLLVSALPVGGGLLLVAFTNRVDFIMLERMTSIEQVGLYGAAYRVTNLLEKFPLLVMGTLYPVMSSLAADDPSRLRTVYRKALWRFALLAVPVTLGTWLIAPWLLTVLFGADYRAAAPALRYLVWSTACLYVAMTGGVLLNSVHRSTDNLVAVAAAALLNIGLNLILIPSYGVAGAAIATAMSFTVLLIITLVAVERQLAR